MFSNGAFPNFFPISAAAAFVLIFAVFEPLFFKYKYKEKNGLSVVFKCAATAAAVVLAVFGAIVQNNGHAWLLCAGLAVCAVADGVISASFLAGLFCFLGAHILLIASFLTASPFRPLSVLLFAFGMVVLIVVLRTLRRNGIKNKMIAPGAAYFTVILCMVSLAVPIAYTTEIRNGVPEGLFAAVGALLFMASDILLARNSLIRYSRRNDIISLSVYYLGIYFLALWAAIPAIAGNLPA